MEEKEVKKTGGLYAKVNMSVKSANIMVMVLIAVLVAVTLFIVAHGGFKIKYDSDGGSYVSEVTAMHSEKLNEPETPQKEGYEFTGWYRDRALTEKWNFDTDTVSESMTLYAGWREK